MLCAISAKQKRSSEPAPEQRVCESGRASPQHRERSLPPMFKTLSQVAAGEALDFDLCIIGAGAAGITIANKLASAPFNVCLLEGGGIDGDAAGQAFYQGISEGYSPLMACRVRFFGGTTNHWTGYCRIPEAQDLQPRSWEPLSGWPISRMDLDPYLPEAIETVEIENEFDADTWARRREVTTLGLATSELYEDVSLVGPPVKFRTKFRDTIDASRSVTCLLHANVVELMPTEQGNRIQELRLKTPEGAERALRAKVFVLACGGIENARMLLASDSRIPGGIGNTHDLVGRYFSDHVLKESGTAVLMRPTEQPLLYEFGRIFEPRMKVHPQIRMTLAFAEQVRTPRVIIRLAPERPSRATRLMEKVTGFWNEAAQVPRTFRISTFAEPLPLPDNRVTLLDERDALGVRRAKLVYEPSDLELQAAREALKKLARALGSTGKGRVQIDESALQAKPFDWGFHHYSTTRMHPDPKLGVVDTDGRVHGVENLFVAGSSIFPTAGLMTPTMTIVALSLRLVGKLQEEIHAS